MGIFFALVMSSSFVEAQINYKTAAGVKFYPGAFSIKHFVTEKNAVEGLFYLWQYGTRITGLYEFHNALPGLGIENLNWYAGVGGHIAFWNNRWSTFYPGRSNDVGIGIDGVIGLDWKVPNAPINIVSIGSHRLTSLDTDTANLAGVALASAMFSNKK